MVLVIQGIVQIINPLTSLLKMNLQILYFELKSLG